MGYVLKATTKDGDYYYMNIMCVTEDVKHAMCYADKSSAQKDMEHFKNMFHYEDVQPVIKKYGGE